MRKILFPLIFLVSTLLLSCSGKSNSVLLDNDTIFSPIYANFQIIKSGDSTALLTSYPWQGAGENDTRIFCIPKRAPQRIVCMSSSYVAMLDALGEIDRVVGVSGIDLITNPRIQEQRDSIGDVGYDGNIDYELLMSLKPDLVLLYSISSASPMETKLRSLGIPFAYIGEYLEQLPLGKSEWIVALGEILGIRERAQKEFHEIEKNYNLMRKRVNGVEKRPVVMVNTPYRDSWVMPSRNSYMKLLISHAGGEYVNVNNTLPQSKPIDIEEAYLFASGADVWINTGTISSLDELKAVLPKFADTPPVRNHRVYNSILRATPGGGNDFWESGVVHPELILRDLIKIFHPEKAQDYPFYYYKKL